MKGKIGILSLVVFALVVSMTSASYFYEPMNFEPDVDTNHSFTALISGEINVTLPQGFELISGSLIGNNSVDFIFSKNSSNASSPEVFVGNIYVDGSLLESYYLLSTYDRNVVDTKVEVGHGDFGYIDTDEIIGTNPLLIFNLIRIWGIGSDLYNEELQNVRFNCTFPNIVPSTVDRKYTTEYTGSNVVASGTLARMEGFSLFRIFVLSQVVNLDDGETYDIVCSDLTYDFIHTRVIASIPDTRLVADSLEPLVISKVNADDYVLYTILNNGSYDIREVQFLFDSGNGILRKELDELKSGDFVNYNLVADDSGQINVSARFVPQWQFTSRNPSYILQESIDSYTTTNPFYNINSSLYFDNHIMVYTELLETQATFFILDLLRDPLFGTEYQIEYKFYSDSGNGELVGSQTVVVQGSGSKSITFDLPEFDMLDIEEYYEVIATISMEDSNGDLWEFPTESLGLITIGQLTSNSPVPQVLNPPINTQGVTILEPTVENLTDRITGGVIQAGSSMSSYGLFILLFIVILIFIIVVTSKNRKHKHESEHKHRKDLYTT